MYARVEDELYFANKSVSTGLQMLLKFTEVHGLGTSRPAAAGQ